MTNNRFIVAFTFWILLFLAPLCKEWAVAQTNTWTGSTDTDWHKTCNWSLNAVPTTAHAVVVPNVTNQPIISAQACVNSIEVQSLGDLVIQTSGDLQIDGTCTPTDNGGCAPTNLLPNPSFENYSCCPSALAQIDPCLDDWINASSGGSTDYFNTCGFTSPGCCGYGAPPAPIPDGNGYIGFLDTWAGSPCFCVRKEYAGVCLSSALTNGQNYTFTFYIANSAGSYGITVAIYGNTNCANMPNAATTCPTSWGTGWVEMGSVAMTPTNTSWTQGTINFTAGGAYNAVILGANCTTAFGPQSQRYFYVDNMALY